MLQAGGGWLAKVTAGWQAGHISNLDYLLYCNLAAGRSFNDLTQVSDCLTTASLPWFLPTSLLPEGAVHRCSLRKCFCVCNDDLVTLVDVLPYLRLGQKELHA